MTAKGKKPKGWRPISVAMQKANHKKTVAKWKPVTVAVQKKRHAKAVHAKAVAKAHPHAKAKTHGAPLVADGVPCCSAQAVATMLQISRGTVMSARDVLDLHWCAGGTDRVGASILAALEGYGNVAARQVQVPDPFGVAELQVSEELGFFLVGVEPVEQHPLILGLHLPDGQSHAVVAYGGVWWSWGEPYEPRTDVVITEAWAVTW